MITVPEAARRTGRSPETIRRWIRAGKLASTKVGTQHLVDEADVDRLAGTARVREGSPAYRPPDGRSPIQVPIEAARDFERIAEQEGRDKSDLFREMLRVYRIWLETQRFEYLQRSFAAKAREIGVTTEKDVERLIQETRRG